MIQIKLIEYNDTFLQEVITLHKKNAKTLGMFPEGAFIEHAKKKCIVGAIKNNQLLGYVLFRITQSKRILSITHLCVETEHRNKGVAKQLLDFVKGKYQQIFRGISLSCRKDYIEASKFYEKNGFKAAKEFRSRSKEEKYLVKWFFDFGNLDLFSSTHLSDSKYNVLLDASIIVKLRDIKEDENNEIQTLNADWLCDEVEYFHAQEMLNEINRDTDQVRANTTRQFISRFKEARFVPEERDSVYKELEQFLLGKSENDISNKIQLAECITSGIDCFVTSDKEILTASEKIFELYSVKVLTPSELILHIDQLKNKPNYKSVRLAGANYESKNIESSDISQLTDLFLSKEHNEKKHELGEKVNLVIGNIRTSYVKIVKDNKEDFIGFVAGTYNDNSISITILRVRKHKIANILFYQIISDILNFASENNLNQIIINDKCLNEFQIEVLENFEFENKDGIYTKTSLRGIIPISDVFAHPVIKAHGWDLRHIKERIETVNAEEKKLLKFQLERKLWPLKILDLDIPTYIIPIRRHWASQLFDSYQANQTLFGAKAELVWHRENIYYRNVKPVSEKFPARILWYVSSENRVTTGRHMGIIACSYLDEVTVAPAKSLFQQYKNFGIYAWEDVYKLAEQDAQKEIKAIRFSDTEVFREIIKLDKITEVLESNGRVKNTFTSPVEVSKEIFNQIYKLGKGI